MIGTSQKTCRNNTLKYVRCKRVAVMKKLFSAIVCLLCAAIGWSQSDSVKVNLSDAEIVFITRDDVATLIERPDSLLLQAMPLLSLSESLQQFSSLRLRSYGPKGTLVSGIGNGLSSDHLAVLWNGVPINSPSLGSVDLSSIAAGQFNQVNVSRGYSSSLTASASGAGTIHLNSGKWSENQLSSSANSIRNTAYAGRFGYALGKINLTTSLQLDDVRNEYNYEDPFLLDRTKRQQHHNNYRRNSFIQYMEWQPQSATTIDAALWLQNSSLNIPGLLGSLGASFATQRDSSIRANVGISHYFNTWKLQVRNAYLTDGQHYRDYMSADAEPFINSQIQTHRWFHQAIATWDWKGYDFQFAVSHQNDFAQTDNYIENKPKRRTTGSQLQVSREFKRWIVEASGRYDVGTVGNIFVPNARVAYAVKNHTVSARFDRLFRYADLNELFWRPGGSPTLNPEQGNRLSLGWTHQKEGDRSKLSTSLSMSYQDMRELILWVNIDDVYTVKNVQDVQNVAVEGAVDFRIELGQLGVNQFLNFSYQNNKGLSDVEDDFFFDMNGRYTLQITKGKWFISGNARYSAPEWNRGSLNTVRGNQEQLWLFDSYIGADFALAKASLGVSASCRNVTDIMDYRNTNAASPGRIVGLNLILKWNTRN